MLAEYKTKTNIGVGLGFLLQLGANIMSRNIGADPILAIVVLIMALVGAVLFIWGCCCYAQGKGQHWALGFLGILSCLGLIILVCLPDKHKEAK